jgi:hypothetical protein
VIAVDRGGPGDGRRVCMVWSFVYLAVRSLFALLLLFGRSERSRELEILVVAS